MSDAPILYPFQADDLAAWLALPAPRVLINANEMGLGKSIDGIVCGRECAHGRILVITLAAARPNWQAEFALWWPDRPAPAEIDKGFTRKAMSAPERVRLQAKFENATHIVSYQLLPKLVELIQSAGDEFPGYDYVIFDELHKCQSWYSKTFQAAWWLRNQYPAADWKILSGTPLGADPLRAWIWLKLCEPAKWGNLRKREQVPFAFRRMYGEQRESEYAFSGYSYTGVNAARLPQFKASIDHLIRRKTCADVALQLPPMRFELTRYAMTENPEDAAADWAEAALTEQSVAVFTHNLPEMARIEAVFVSRGLPHVRLHQEHSAAERESLVANALRAGNAAILSTTGLVGTGINFLANIRSWMLAQPSENPIEIQQLSGRFRRLSSVDRLPRVGYLLYREGDEFAAQKALAKRLATDKGIVKSTEDADELEKIIAGKSNRTFLDTLKLLGRSYAAHAADDDGDDNEE